MSNSTAPTAPPPQADGYYRPGRSFRRTWIIIAVIAPLALVYIARNEPTDDSWYPRCVFFKLTGCHCTGCGTTRCLHALLNGDLLQALAYNLFTVAMLPFVLFWFFRNVGSALFGWPIRIRRASPWLIGVLMVFVLSYWVLRNIPRPPFNALAPHRLEGRAAAPAGDARAAEAP
jgi:hypothetical protein